MLLVLILMIASAIGGAYAYRVLDGKMAVRDAMKAVEKVDISDYDIDQLHDRDSGDPEIEPERQIQYRQQFQQTNRREQDIRESIQSGTEFADGIRLPGHSAVDHIRKTRDQIERVKSRR